MEKTFNPDGSGTWAMLANRRKQLDNTTLLELFEREPDRFLRMQASAAGLTLDYSKHLVNGETLDLLVEAAEGLDLKGRIEALFRGEHVNNTEDRPALHTALRDFSGGAPCSGEVGAVFTRMADLVRRIHAGEWLGCTEERITDVVNIGIGGSHLGPMMATRALAAYRAGGINCHFVSNIDSADLHGVLEQLRPETTLFIVASKTFTTLETLTNAGTARQWMAEVARDREGLARHFVAVSANPDRARAFGIDPANVLPMWDWVGGRYSLWSAIGLPIALGTGMETFNRLRGGAAAMDEHFRSAPFDRNLPVLQALLGFWYTNYWSAGSLAVLPYVHRLQYLPEFLQQLEMESNGKSARRGGRPVDYPTAPVIWGTVETNGQHSFHQLLHQGTRLIPVDFILALTPARDGDPHHPHLVANCLAQANALMTGRRLKEATWQLRDGGMPAQEAAAQAPHLAMPGNRPSSTIVMERLEPETLGALIALYEHKVFVQSVLWDINAFDQFGVELGKAIGRQVYARLTGSGVGEPLDAATEGLIGMYRKANNLG